MEFLKYLKKIVYPLTLIITISRVDIREEKIKPKEDKNINMMNSIPHGMYSNALMIPP